MALNPDIAHMTKLRRTLLFLPVLAATLAAQTNHDAVLKPFKFRNIGPAVMGGRVDDFAVVESDPRIIYVGAAAGGIFKTTNGGTTWEPIFDEVGSPSIGDIALAPNNPAILYAGTGEPNNRQSSSWGSGVYKSMDAGETWKFSGLKDTFHIGRVVVHPTNSDIVYVAALGDLWGPNADRGVFMSTDGGATWNKTLYIDDDTGISDIAIDPESPNVLYAAAYTRRRTVYGYNGGGPKGGDPKGGDDHDDKDDDHSGQCHHETQQRDLSGCRRRDFPERSAKDRWPERPDDGRESQGDCHAERQAEIAHREPEGQAADAPEGTPEIAPEEHVSR